MVRRLHSLSATTIIAGILIMTVIVKSRSLKKWTLKNKSVNIANLDPSFTDSNWNDIADYMVTTAKKYGKLYIPVITSGNDSTTHMKTSKHYLNKAIDIRTNTYPPEEIQNLIKKMKLILGPNFTVLFETDHMHVQYNK